MHICILSIRAQHSAQFASGPGNYRVPQFSLVLNKLGKSCSSAGKFMPAPDMQVVTVLCHPSLWTWFCSCVILAYIIKNMKHIKMVQSKKKQKNSCDLSLLFSSEFLPFSSTKNPQSIQCFSYASWYGSSSVLSIVGAVWLLIPSKGKVTLIKCG